MNNFVAGILIAPVLYLSIYGLFKMLKYILCKTVEKEVNKKIEKAKEECIGYTNKEISDLEYSIGRSYLNRGRWKPVLEAMQDRINSLYERKRWK